MKTVSATVTQEIALWLEEKSQKEDRKKSILIRRILRKAMDNEKDPVSIDLKNNQDKS